MKDLKIKETFKSIKFKGGAYTTAVSLVVIVIILLVNIIVTELGIQIDVTSDNLYTLTDTTKDYVKSIDDEVTLYYLVEAGNEDQQTKEVVDEYKSLGGNIKVEYKDPVLNPQFSKNYVDDDISQNSVIVVNQTSGKAKYVDYSSMYLTEVDYNTMQQSVTGIDVEGKITSAIQYVTAENLPIMYIVEGHGEMETSTILTDSMDKENITAKTFNTLTSEKVPEDCSLLLVKAPSTDYTDKEVDIIKEYLQNGGDAIFLLDNVSKTLPNMNRLLEYYGITTVDGMVVETDPNHYMGQYMNNLVPNIENHGITSNLTKDQKAVVIPIGTGIELLDTARSTIETEYLLRTSESAFSKTNAESTSVNKEEGDIDGPFTLGMVLSENYNDVETKIVVLGSPLVIEDSLLSYQSVGNLELFLGSINYVVDREESLAINSRSYGLEQLYLTGSQVYFWAAVVVIVIPAATLIAGGIIVYKRRKK